MKINQAYRCTPFPAARDKQVSFGVGSASSAALTERSGSGVIRDDSSVRGDEAAVLKGTLGAVGEVVAARGEPASATAERDCEPSSNIPVVALEVGVTESSSIGEHDGVQSRVGEIIEVRLGGGDGEGGELGDLVGGVRRSIPVRGLPVSYTPRRSPANAILLSQGERLCSHDASASPP